MLTKEEALEKIKSLIERFDEQKEFYKNKDYNETQTRRDFIDPFWKALGWDVDNENGYAESYREVIHEDRVKIGGITKAPDYSFRLVGGKRLFFLEAKKPSVYIKDDVAPAYQIRRYGWSAKLPISVISDFEEFAIYDCYIKPKESDKASTGRIKYLTYQQYISEFDFIWDTFAKERVLKGSFDKFIKSDKNKRGTTTVDNEFLQSLDKWRVELALNIAKRNKDINEDELNFVVQNTIDRIIFLRIAEDRNVENYGELQNCLISGDYYKNLLQYFHIADQKYNSGLFDFQKDKISDRISIENKVIKNILKELYYPECPYEFSVISVEILGSAYEQFLGKQITLSKTGRATIEEKPEVRKAGGVYYTPQYIVDYIVKNTLGKLLEGKKPDEVSKIKIVDPACGSGSFLIGAYQYLLDWHKDFYNNLDKISKGEKDNPLTPQGELTTNEKRRILLNNIYGVDLDSNAVEVTKLSLLLKCMEGETRESIESQTILFHERVLPSLDNNIKSGNSLIDLDYYENEIDYGEERKIKPFSWEKAFPEVFASTGSATKGGFDVVIGNPPYVNIVAIPLEQREYLKTKYKTYKNKSDLYSFFVERALHLINNTSGIFAYIIPNTWLTTDSFQLLRKILISNRNIEEIVELGHNIFEEVTVSTIILICSHNNSIIRVKNRDFSLRINIPIEKWLNSNYQIQLHWSLEKEQLFNKMIHNSIKLENILKFSRGIKTSNDKRFISFEKKDENSKPIYRGRNIKAYSKEWAGEYIWYRPDLMKEKVGCLPHSKEFFEAPEKLITQRVSMGVQVAYDDNNNYFLDTTNVSRFQSWDKKHSFKYILAIMNSKLINFWFNDLYKMPTVGLYELHSIPFKTIDFNNTKENNAHKEIIKLVDQLLQLNKDIQNETLPERIEQIKNRIEYCESKIDQIVYELYDLTEEEIKIIEGVPFGSAQGTD